LYLAQDPDSAADTDEERSAKIERLRKALVARRSRHRKSKRKR
jgi:hypothetical protein